MDNLEVITIYEGITHKQLSGVTVYPMWGDVSVGDRQQVLVDVAAGVEIPLHSHSVDAMMYIASGDGYVLSDDPQINGNYVTTGTQVSFEKDRLHGFRAGENGLRFISDNGGIIDHLGENWDIAFTDTRRK